VRAGRRGRRSSPTRSPPPACTPQLPLSLQRPPVSPYLNLLGTNRNPAINYYGIVRPELRFQVQQQALGQQVRRLEGQVDELDTRRARPAGEPDTGSRSYYFNYSHYYPSGGRARQ